MNKKINVYACLIAILTLSLSYQTALAHESITVGDYEIVYGWINEPPIAGQLNGVEIFVNDTSGGTEQPVEQDVVSSLVVELSYGGQSKTLILEPVFDAPGAFDATLIPTIPGLYSLKFSGTLADTAVDEQVELEEVQAADAVEFPDTTKSAQPSASSGITNWLIYLSLLIGLIALGLGMSALRKAR